MERSMMLEPIPSASDPGLLRSFELCRASRFDAFRDSLNGVFYPSRIEPIGHDNELDHSLLSATKLKHLTVGFVRFGTEARLDPGALGAYHVNVAPVGDRRIALRPAAGLRAPGARRGLHAAGAHLPAAVERRRRPGVHQDQSPFAGERAGVDGAVALSELDSEGSLVRDCAAHREQIERLVISSLLRAQPHNSIPM